MVRAAAHPLPCRASCATTGSQVRLAIVPAARPLFLSEIERERGRERAAKAHYHQPSHYCWHLDWIIVGAFYSSLPFLIHQSRHPLPLAFAIDPPLDPAASLRARFMVTPTAGEAVPDHSARWVCHHLMLSVALGPMGILQTVVQCLSANLSRRFTSRPPPSFSSVLSFR